MRTHSHHTYAAAICFVHCSAGRPSASARGRSAGCLSTVCRAECRRSRRWDVVDRAPTTNQPTTNQPRPQPTTTPDQAAPAADVRGHSSIRRADAGRSSLCQDCVRVFSSPSARGSVQCACLCVPSVRLLPPPPRQFGSRTMPRNGARPGHPKPGAMKVKCARTGDVRFAAAAVDV